MSYSNQKKRKKKPIHQELFAFSDSQLAQEMEEEWQILQNRQDLDHLQKQTELSKIYEQRRQKKKVEINKDKLKSATEKLRSKIMIEEEVDFEKHLDDQEEGEIIEPGKSKSKDNLPSFQEYATHIKPLLLTRSKLEDLLNLPRFDEFVSGCFIRYQCNKSNEYTVAQILSVVESNSKQYKIGNTETNLLLKVQIAANQVQNLSMNTVSNQGVSGGMEINRWFANIKDKIPYVENLIKKKEQLEKWFASEISTQEINTNIMKNIEKVIRKEKELREDYTSFVSFLNERNHHIQISLRQLEERDDDDDSTTQKERRSRFSRQPLPDKPKITQTKQQLLEDKNKIQQYLKQLKDIRLTQVEKKQEKREQVKAKPQKMYDTRLTRQDRILEKMNERTRRLGIANQAEMVREEILQFHRSSGFHIDLKM